METFYNPCLFPDSSGQRKAPRYGPFLNLYNMEKFRTTIHLENPKRPYYGQGIWENVPETVQLERCDACGHYVNRDAIQHHKDSGMDVCDSCYPDFLKAIEDEK